MFWLFLFLGYLAGVFYRLSEIEHIWKHATFDYRWGERINIKIETWIPRWMTGELRIPEGNFVWFWFNVFTFSIFKDGYHFFNFAQVLSLILPFVLFRDFTYWDMAAFFLIRWLGTDTTLAIITKEI